MSTTTTTAPAPSTGQPAAAVPPHGGWSMGAWSLVGVLLLIGGGAAFDALRGAERAPDRAAVPLGPFETVEPDDVRAGVTATTAAVLVTDRPVDAGEELADAVERDDIAPARVGDVVVAVPLAGDDPARPLLGAGSVVTMLLTPLPDGGDHGSVVADVRVLRLTSDSIVVSVHPSAAAEVARVGLDRVTFAVPVPPD